MRVAMLGGTGSIGAQLLREAVDRGYDVTALVRDLSRTLSVPVDKRLADATDPASLAEAVAGHDAVISALGGAKQGRAEVVVLAARALLQAMPLAGVDRLLVVGGAGSLQWPDLPGVDGVDAPGFPTAWKPASLAQRQALGVYRAADTPVNWTYLSPPDVIEPGERTGRYSIGRDEFVVDSAGASRISIADYAIALLDELENGAFPRARFTVGYTDHDG